MKRFLRKCKALAVVSALALVCAAGPVNQTGYADTQKYYCGFEEHTHSDACYEQVLICGMEEGQTDAVYETERILICGQEESIGHTHSEECCDEEGNLICGMEEGAGGHTHDESCYTQEQVLVSGSETPHEHTDACYETVLTCTRTEHTHTLSCTINVKADLETAKVWEATLPKSKLTGVWAEDVVTIARSQIGYTESSSNFQLSEDGKTKNGYTRYGAWYGSPYADWCAMFASFCLHYAGVPKSEFPEESSCASWVSKLKSRDLYAKASDYDPQPGDLIFFDNSGSGKSDHVGIVETVKTADGSVTEIRTIEGNCGNKVREKTYSPGNKKILGYGKLPRTDEGADEYVTWEASDGGIRVSVTALAGVLPGEAELTVSRLDEESEEYGEAVEVLEPEDNIQVVALTITFLSGGEEVEPAGALDITLDASGELPEEADASTMKVQRLEETDDGLAAVLLADAEDESEGTVDVETAVATYTVEDFSAAASEVLTYEDPVQIMELAAAQAPEEPAGPAEAESAEETDTDPVLIAAEASRVRPQAVAPFIAVPLAVLLFGGHFAGKKLRERNITKSP